MLTTQDWSWRLGLARTLAIGVILASGDEPTVAQITPDATLGAENSLVTPNTTVEGLPAELIEGGATRGANLFHSFLEFNVGNDSGFTLQILLGLRLFLVG